MQPPFSYQYCPAWYWWAVPLVRCILCPFVKVCVQITGIFVVDMGWTIVASALLPCTIDSHSFRCLALSCSLCSIDDQAADGSISCSIAEAAERSVCFSYAVQLATAGYVAQHDFRMHLFCMLSSILAGVVRLRRHNAVADCHRCCEANGVLLARCACCSDRPRLMLVSQKSTTFCVDTSDRFTPMTRKSHMCRIFNRSRCTSASVSRSMRCATTVETYSISIRSIF